ncbi:unnamed protein product [Callosobruchus maculatus]|nr:unnamed protein product [Callosobruchus maculatus]
MTDTIQTLENKYRESESNRVLTEQQKREVDMQAAQVEEQAVSIEGDLKVEREWRMSLQDTMQQDREKISKLQIEISQLKTVAQKYAQLQEDYYTMKDHCLEQDHTLEELGAQLRDSKLEISDLKEEINRNRPDGAWVKDNTALECKACNKDTTVVTAARFSAIPAQTTLYLCPPRQNQCECAIIVMFFC